MLVELLVSAYVLDNIGVIPMRAYRAVGHAVTFCILKGTSREIDMTLYFRKFSFRLECFSRPCYFYNRLKSIVPRCLRILEHEPGIDCQSSEVELIKHIEARMLDNLKQKKNVTITLIGIEELILSVNYTELFMNVPNKAILEGYTDPPLCTLDKITVDDSPLQVFVIMIRFENIQATKKFIEEVTERIPENIRNIVIAVCISSKVGIEQNISTIKSIAELILKCSFDDKTQLVFVKFSKFLWKLVRLSIARGKLKQIRLAVSKHVQEKQSLCEGEPIQSKYMIHNVIESSETPKKETQENASCPMTLHTNRDLTESNQTLHDLKHTHDSSVSVTKPSGDTRETLVHSQSSDNLHFLNLNRATSLQLEGILIEDTAKIWNSLKNVILRRESAKQTFTLLDKISFEIEGLLRQSEINKGADVKKDNKTVYFSPSLQRNILSVNGVYGCGTVYNRLTVDIEASDNEQEMEVKKQVMKVLSGHDMYQNIVMNVIKSANSKRKLSQLIQGVE